MNKMLKSIWLPMLLLLFQSVQVSAQFTKVENPGNYYLGYLGVVEHRDTLFTTTAILSGFDNTGVKLYYSVDEGSTWQAVEPESGLTNQKLETTSPSGLYGSDNLLALAMRRVVLFSTDAGKNWTSQTSIASTNDENRGRFFAEIDNVVLAGTADDTNDGGTGIYRKEGDGAWELITEGLDANEPNGAPNVVQLETDGSRVFLSASDGFYISDDKGLSFTRTVVNSIKNKFARRGSTILAAGTGGGTRDFGFWKSEDNGETFTELIIPEVFDSGVIYRPGILCMAADEEHFYVGFNTNTTFNGGNDGGVWMSTDGNEWTNIGLKGQYISNLSTSENRIFASVGELYGTENGLYFIDKASLSTATESETQLVQQFELFQNYPNPFNPSTSIHYSIRESSPIQLQVVNSLGQVVATLIDGTVSAGNHSVNFDASALSSGVYFYKLTTNYGSITKSMTLLK